MAIDNPKQRLDVAMAERCLAPSRSRARDMIARGNVAVDGMPALRASAKVPPDADIRVEDETSTYASRAAVKLVVGLDAGEIDVRGRRAVDLGASTGGFTQVLLERGADHVTAIDVGHGQIIADLRNDTRVTVLERQNARELTRDHLSDPFDLIVCDVSFISLQLAAEPALLLAEPHADAVLLVKPQFQVGREGIGKDGLAKSEALVQAAVGEVIAWFDALPGWEHRYVIPSPIRGGDGNTEYLLVGIRR